MVTTWWQHGDNMVALRTVMITHGELKRTRIMNNFVSNVQKLSIEWIIIESRQTVGNEMMHLLLIINNINY